MYEKCPVCGLEVLKGSKKCPSCNTVLIEKELKEPEKKQAEPKIIRNAKTINKNDYASRFFDFLHEIFKGFGYLSFVICVLWVFPILAKQYSLEKNLTIISILILSGLVFFLVSYIFKKCINYSENQNSGIFYNSTPPHSKLIYCPACANRISINAKQCPQCGEPMSKKEKRSVFLDSFCFMIITGILGFLIGFIEPEMLFGIEYAVITAGFTVVYMFWLSSKLRNPFSHCLMVLLLSQFFGTIGIFFCNAIHWTIFDILINTLLNFLWMIIGIALSKTVFNKSY